MENKFYILQTENAMDLPLPSYMTEGAAGMDVYANVHEDTILAAGEIMAVPLGFRMALPSGFEAQMRPRSGLAMKYGITMPNAPGTIDSDYRGEVSILLLNLGKEDFVIRRGDRIGQMIIARYERVDWTIAPSLDNTERGDGGFGHTGK